VKNERLRPGKRRRPNDYIAGPLYPPGRQISQISKLACDDITGKQQNDCLPALPFDVSLQSGFLEKLVDDQTNDDLNNKAGNTAADELAGKSRDVDASRRRAAGAKH